MEIELHKEHDDFKSNELRVVWKGMLNTHERY